MTELYTAAQLVLFPFAALAAIVGAVSIIHTLAGVVTGNAGRAALNMLLAAACTGALWAYLMIPGGLG